MSGMLTAPYQDWAKKHLGFEYENIQLLITALTHRSYVNEHKKSVTDHNERLEFLGLSGVVQTGRQRAAGQTRCAVEWAALPLADFQHQERSEEHEDIRRDLARQDAQLHAGRGRNTRPQARLACAHA